MIAGASESHIPSPMAADLLRLQRRCTAAEQMARAQAAHLLTACTSSPDHVPAGQRVSPGQPERSFRQSRATAGESTAQTLTGKAEMPHKQLIHVAPLAAASLPILSRVVASLLQVQTSLPHSCTCPIRLPICVRLSANPGSIGRCKCCNAALSPPQTTTSVRYGHC